MTTTTRESQATLGFVPGTDPVLRQSGLKIETTLEAIAATHQRDVLEPFRVTCTDHRGREWEWKFPVTNLIKSEPFPVAPHRENGRVPDDVMQEWMDGVVIYDELPATNTHPEFDRVRIELTGNEGCDCSEWSNELPCWPCFRDSRQ